MFSKLYASFILTIISILFLCIVKVDSITCYECESKDGVYNECDQGLVSNLTKKSCGFDESNRELKYCFKIYGVGVKSGLLTTLRGCHHQNYTRNFTTDNPLRKMTKTGEYNVPEKIYICETDLCNSSFNHTCSFALVVFSFGLFSFYYKSHTQISFRL